MRRSTPLAPGGSLPRRTRLRPVGKKRAAKLRKRRKVVATLIDPHDDPCRLAIEGVCQGEQATETHETLPRSASGESVTNVAVMVRACWRCHRHAHLHPKAAYEAGWLVSRYAGKTVPA